MKRFAPLAACLLLAACTDPAPTDTAPPPEPQADAAPAAGQHTELRDAMQAPLDKARAAEEAQESQDAERDEVLKDAGA